MRAVAIGLLLALAVVVTHSALAGKGGGGYAGGAKVHGGHVSGGKVYGGHASGGRVYGGHVSHGHSHFNGHHHHGHHHSTTFVGVGFGFAYPWSWYGYYPPPYYYPSYYYPHAVAYPAQPVTYVEQGAQAPAETAGWWYYCETSRTYYPYVRECPTGWQRVPAVPPPPN